MDDSYGLPAPQSNLERGHPRSVYPTSLSLDPHLRPSIARPILSLAFPSRVSESLQTSLVLETLRDSIAA